MSRRRWLGVAGVAVAVSCANGLVTAPLTPQALLPLADPASVDGSAICRDLAERFIGLPATNQPPGDSEKAAALLSGRWWIRSCSARTNGSQLEVRLQGPGWYWVDETGSGMSVKQQVPFRLSLEIVGRLHQSFSEGVLSLWLEPTSEPQAQVDAPSALKVESANAWGRIVELLPLVSPEEIAAERFSKALSGALRERLRAGATLTYDIRLGQPDATIGTLPAGTTPRHPFEDAATWIVNDRVLLPASATQALGPIPPGSLTLDAKVERGPGLSYRSICVDEMSENFASIASGELGKVPSGTWVEAGTVTGLGLHTTSLQVDRCSFYLVLSTLQASSTIAALRLR